MLCEALVASLDKEQLVRLRIANRFVIGGIALCCLVQMGITLMAVRDMRQERMYPVQEVAYLKSHPFYGHLFTLYNWGGYVIWQLPNEKEFIDGRMPSWRQNIAGESSYAFGDYLALGMGKLSFTKVAKEYNITTLLLPKEKTDTKSRKLPAFLKWLMPTDQSSFSLSKAALKAGFHPIFSGEVGTIYQRY